MNRRCRDLFNFNARTQAGVSPLACAYVFYWQLYSSTTLSSELLIALAG
jgi:hypothetical protein